MSKTPPNLPSGLSGFAPHEVIEEEIDAWMLTRRMEERTSKAQLWMELAKVLGVTDRQVKRYYTGETPLPVDKVVPFCNHIRSIRLVHYFLDAVDRDWVEDLDPLDFVDELLKSVEAFSGQARLAAQALKNRPSEKDFRQIQAAGRRLRDQVRRFEWLYKHTYERHRAAVLKAAEERRRRRSMARVREAMESGQLGLFQRKRDEGGDF